MFSARGARALNANRNARARVRNSRIAPS